MRKAYSIVFMLLFILLMSGCKEKNPVSHVIRIGILRGPSTIAFTQWMRDDARLSGKAIEIKLMDTPDQIVASFVQGKSDVAVLPMITAANLYNHGVDCHLLGCPLWGTLYIVERPSSETTPKLLLFGSATTPGLLARAWIEKNGSHYHPYFAFNNAREVMGALLMHRADAALLSEPFVSIALSKDSSLRIAADLNRMEGFDDGFAQTALICHSDILGLSEAIDSLSAVSCRYAHLDPAATIRMLEQKKLFPVGALTPATITRCKIDYRDAASCKENVKQFLQIINSYQPKAIGGKLPDDGFYNLSRP